MIVMLHVLLYQSCCMTMSSYLLWFPIHICDNLPKLNLMGMVKLRDMKLSSWYHTNAL